MKLTLLYLQGQIEKWTDTACAGYEKKISALLPFEQVAIRSPSRSRLQFDEKRDEEGRSILKALKSASDQLILFDEHGHEFANSREFSNYLIKKVGGSSRTVFAIGGPYGFSQDVRNRASGAIRLSSLTFNHHLARVVALEQIYRALTIWKGLPYHND